MASNVTAKRYKYPRPGYVTAISYLLFLWGGAGLFLVGVLIFSGAAKDPEEAMPVWLDAVCVVAAAMLIVCAIFMLKGKNWARILFYIAGAPTILIVRILAAAHSPSSAEGYAAADTVGTTIAGFVYLIISYATLSAERSNRFFTGRSTFFKRTEEEEVGRNKRDPKQNYDY